MCKIAGRSSVAAEVAASLWRSILCIEIATVDAKLREVAPEQPRIRI